MVSREDRLFPLASGRTTNKRTAMLSGCTNYFVRERVGFVKLTDTYDILDPQTQHVIGIAKEEPPGWAKWLRLVINKQVMPTRLTSTKMSQSRLLFPSFAGSRSCVPR